MATSDSVNSGGPSFMQAQSTAPTQCTATQRANAGNRSDEPLWHHGLPWSPANPYNYDTAGG
jgi:hypothetical protein